jgi:hypothetical protein
LSKFALFPKEIKFYAYIEQQADNIVKMAQQLKDMIYIWQNIKERASMIADMEHDGDAITHDIATLLHRTFMPPIDKEDASAITYALDEIADHIHDTADALYLYRIEAPTDRAKELSDIILKVTTEVRGGITDIISGIRQPVLLTRYVAINQIENTGDTIYRSAMAEIFAQSYDMAYVVKWREIYKKMEAVIDSGEDFGDVLEGIALKYG